MGQGVTSKLILCIFKTGIASEKKVKWSKKITEMLLTEERNNQKISYLDSLITLFSIPIVEKCFHKFS